MVMARFFYPVTTTSEITAACTSVLELRPSRMERCLHEPPIMPKFAFMINIEEIREYCLSLPHTSEDMAFGEDYLILRVCDKIFACIGLVRNDYLALKCDPDRALDLRDQYPDIEPAWHWNKKYWNQVRISGNLQPDFVKSLIRHSYAEVVKKMPKRTRLLLPEIYDITP